ncbi:hypothetical protein [Burkholderia sp. Ac-20365]|uniref:hypothetical protein n=1 Tax=Burkholderia sp. Ac-20365 TaxID=2703897 RepID=UPI00197C7FC7|nr:hypothetical protein [Burkholderia sp. Ac-20365]MBN3759725.1 hypothetical protein [Burkholderia sp. Ac-20365]
MNVARVRAGLVAAASVDVTTQAGTPTDRNQFERMQPLILKGIDEDPRGVAGDTD